MKMERLQNLEFDRELKEKITAAEDVVISFLPKEEGFSALLQQSMNYSMRAGGKRLRPILMQETFRLFGGTSEVIRPFMAAIEMIHTHSLIHDDLPAIDNDEYRRGKKTNHAVYGEAMGILSGDALLNYAYETAFLAFDTKEDPKRIARALKILAGKTGAFGMIGGQSVDVMNEKNCRMKISREQLEAIYENKTSALLEASMMIGAVLAGAAGEQVALMEQAAKLTGLAFQIQDDILDATGTMEELGKPVGSDEKNEKTTFVTLSGVEGAKKEAERRTDRALEILSRFSGTDDFLLRLVSWLLVRKK